jgi:tetratricopeptide (TPR) repeat protein
MSQMGGVNVDESYEILMGESEWGRLNEPDVTVDRESYRDSRIPKNNFIRLAQALMERNKLDSAVNVADRFIEFFPDEKVKFDLYMLPFVEVYYVGGETEKANSLVEQLLENYLNELNYYNSLNSKHANDFAQDRQQAIMVIDRLGEIAGYNGQTELQKKIKDILKIHAPSYQ